MFNKLKLELRHKEVNKHERQEVLVQEEQRAGQPEVSILFSDRIHGETDSRRSCIVSRRPLIWQEVIGAIVG